MLGGATGVGSLGLVSGLGGGLRARATPVAAAPAYAAAPAQAGPAAPYVDPYVVCEDYPYGFCGYGDFTGLGVGDPFPDGFDVYNVPFAFRDRYADSDAAFYRYAYGNIYQVDPETQLIQQIVSTLV
jgi:hypothetical protein